VAATRPVRPAERYGDRPRRSSRAAMVVAVLAGLSLLGLGWLAWLHASTPVSGELTAFTVRSAHQVSVTVEIHRGGDFPGGCSVQALAVDHSVVGRRTIVIRPPAPRTTTVSRIVRTSRLATGVQLVSCRRR
jgi:uncharacterized protein DUF4307